MGGDPIPGVVKYLNVVYSWGGPEEHTVSTQEGQVRVCPAPMCQWPGCARLTAMPHRIHWQECFIYAPHHHHHHHHGHH